MKTIAQNPDDYLSKVPEDRRAALTKLRATIATNLPDGFEETMSYGMIGYVVPRSIYPSGYHCDPKLPLPYMSIANQKNFIALYHCGIYADDQIMRWFIEEFPKHSNYKLDMGKSCIRFKKPDFIPFELIGELVKKISVQDFIDLYEGRIKNS
ncbi:DUF1801 domain-containing protein [Echinicola soli]|uniref:DUF1801 domain-containing protein n=1 Tax=Echinicola soli TaxID=2591634 RepID=A0A514CKH7_9BACT|nr:DUF1801 domain-containing protein [Echinicola soli]QDH80164.1 DUF1801 domain-containing protein [Echinicola soli]